MNVGINGCLISHLQQYHRFATFHLKQNEYDLILLTLCRINSSTVPGHPPLQYIPEYY
jgi:hypothetical protein